MATAQPPGRTGSPLHPADLRIMQQRFDVDAALLPICLERCRNGVEADPVLVFEAVRQCLLAAVDPNGNSVDQVRFDPFRMSGAAEPGLPSQRIGQAAAAPPPRDGDADFVRNLKLFGRGTLIWIPAWPTVCQFFDPGRTRITNEWIGDRAPTVTTDGGGRRQPYRLPQNFRPKSDCPGQHEFTQLIFSLVH